MSQDMELVCFQLIANSGAAKSSYMEAVELAKRGDFKGADEKITEAEECFVQAIILVLGVLNYIPFIKVHDRVMENQYEG